VKWESEGGGVMEGESVNKMKVKRSIGREINWKSDQRKERELGE